jgi:predicted dehydrogenase
MQQIGWGILGAANIARKNWLAIRNSGNGRVVAVASRDRTRARQFVQECQADASIEGVIVAENYEAVLQNREVHAVYVPLPTAVRKEWVIRAAEAGKHVLCEKPCANSVQDLREMIEACARNKVQFMDGVMFMHSARLPKLREVMASELGQIKRITSEFSFLGSDEFFNSNIRLSAALEPFGCLGDLGWYCIRLALWVMNGQVPTSVSGRILQSSKGVPTEFSGELHFADKVSSSFYCSFHSETAQWAHIDGTKGLVRLDDFVLPFYGSEVEFEISHPNFAVTGCDFHMEPSRKRVTVPEYSNSHANAQETNLFRNFATIAQTRQLVSYWPDIALKTQQVMEACLESGHRGTANVGIV